MATTKSTAAQTWTEVHDGACIIDLQSGGKIRVHFGAVAPAEDTEDYILIESHSRAHKEDRDGFYYPFTDKVFVKAHSASEAPQFVVVG